MNFICIILSLRYENDEYFENVLNIENDSKSAKIALAAKIVIVY